MDSLVLYHLEEMDKQLRDKVKPQLLRVVEKFHQLDTLQVTLWHDRTTLVPWFKVDEISWEAQKNVMIHDYKLEFAKDAVPEEMINACRVNEWISWHLQDGQQMHSTKQNWKSCFEWLCPNRTFGVEQEEAIRQSFVALGVDLNAEQRAASEEEKIDEYWPKESDHS